MAKLIGYRNDIDGERLLLFSERNDKYYVEYKGKPVEVLESYEMVEDGTYNQPVRGIPYIILDNNVYDIGTFKEVGARY